MDRSISFPDKNEWAKEQLEKAISKIKAECERLGNGIPFIPIEGHYLDCMMPGGLHWWTNGFWPGLLYLCNEYQEDDFFLVHANAISDRLSGILNEKEKLEHDTGFLIQLSSVAQYCHTKDASVKKRALQAADCLAARYNSAGKFLRAWNQSPWADDVSGWVIIDCMMNLSLLFWAYEETSEQRYYDIAYSHAKTAQNFLLRADGSCAHIATFDPISGAFIGEEGGQGYAKGSSWSRGQGWALYGFTLAYMHTKDTTFLDAAKRSAHYCIASLSQSEYLPLVDFRAPEEPVKYDSGAGMIIADGLLALAACVPEFEQKLYIDSAFRILKTCTDRFANFSLETDGTIDGGSTMYHDDRLSDKAIIYNDYFYVEALLRLFGKEIKMW